MTPDTTQDLTGKTVLITGATSGIGLEVAVVLARHGAHTTIVGRNPQKTDAVLAQIRARSGSQAVDALLCDMSSQTAIRRMAAIFRNRHGRLDILVNNAGTVFARRTLTEDGVEATFAVNHLGYFLLTNLLLDLIVASAPSRIVNVASTAHYGGTLDLQDPAFEHGYTIMKAYARSKLANVLFTRELARRLADKAVTVNAVHPGTVATHIWDGAPRWAQPALALGKRLFMISPAEGARTITYLCMAPVGAQLSGCYFEKNRPHTPASAACDVGFAARLWEVSERLTGLVQEGSPE